VDGAHSTIEKKQPEECEPARMSGDAALFRPEEVKGVFDYTPSTGQPAVWIRVCLTLPVDHELHRQTAAAL
jgi:hypothetical protein